MKEQPAGKWVVRKSTLPSYNLPLGHLVGVCQRRIILDWTRRALCWKVTSPITTFLINFCAIACAFCLAPHHLDVTSQAQPTLLNFQAAGEMVHLTSACQTEMPGIDEADLMRAEQRVLLQGCFELELVASWQPNSRGGEEGSRSQTHPLMALPQEPVPSSWLLFLTY